MGPIFLIATELSPHDPSWTRAVAAGAAVADACAPILGFYPEVAVASFGIDDGVTGQGAPGSLAAVLADEAVKGRTLAFLLPAILEFSLFQRRRWSSSRGSRSAKRPASRSTTTTWIRATGTWCRRSPRRCGRHSQAARSRRRAWGCSSLRAGRATHAGGLGPDLAYGPGVIAEIVETDGLARLLAHIEGPAERVFVKVTWHGYATGTYTDAAALDQLLSALSGRAIVLEGHSTGRNLGGASFDWENEARTHRAWLRDQEELGEPDASAIESAIQDELIQRFV